jgi:hypothetical protein
MKSVLAALAFAAALAMQSLWNVPVLAQATTPAAVTPAGASSAAAPVPVAERKSPSRAKQRAGERADARVCLEFPNNLQIIKCAEKYRYMREPA